MKILYLANHRLPTEKAYGIQISKMCEVFSDAGMKVRLVAPYRISKIKENFFRYYGVKENFEFKKIFSLDFYLPGRLDQIAFQIKHLISAFILAIYALSHEANIIYSRDELPLYLLSFFRENLFFEVHKFSKKRIFLYKRFKNRKIKIIAISNGIKNEFQKIGFDSNNILVAFDAVDLKDFDINVSKTEARKKLNLPLDKKIVAYSGHLFKWKGVDTLIEAALILKEFLFVFIGGTDKDIKDSKVLIKEHQAKNILFLGHKPYRDIPFYLKAADALVLPNKKEEKISELYTSPLKLFEYMASGRPIIASDLPSLREVLDENSAVFFESGDSSQLAESIKNILNNENLGRSISSRAFEKVKNHTWENRAKKILDFVG
ncbi:MAG: glycosyltransferase family 4 protein [Patescibacteria group bacterium]